MFAAAAAVARGFLSDRLALTLAVGILALVSPSPLVAAPKGCPPVMPTRCVQALPAAKVAQPAWVHRHAYRRMQALAAAEVALPARADCRQEGQLPPARAYPSDPRKDSAWRAPAPRKRKEMVGAPA